MKNSLNMFATRINPTHVKFCLYAGHAGHVGLGRWRSI